jgi:hypothetical protein
MTQKKNRPYVYPTHPSVERGGCATHTGRRLFHWRSSVLLYLAWMNSFTMFWIHSSSLCSLNLRTLDPLILTMIRGASRGSVCPLALHGHKREGAAEGQLQPVLRIPFDALNEKVFDKGTWEGEG